MNMVSRGVRGALALLGALAWLALAVSAAGAADNARTSAQPINSATTDAALIADLFANESVATFYVSGLTASGATLTIEGSSDGRKDNDPLKAWSVINAIPATCPVIPFSTLTTDQGFRIDTSGLTNVRVRVSSGGTGTILVSYNAIPGAAVSLGACGTIPSSPIYLYKSAGPMQFLSAGQLATAQNLPNIPATATVAEICVETAAVRYRDDGNSPSASVGVPVVGTSSAPFCFQYAGPLSAFQVILATGAPTIDIAYYVSR